MVGNKTRWTLCDRWNSRKIYCRNIQEYWFICHCWTMYYVCECSSSTWDQERLLWLCKWTIWRVWICIKCESNVPLLTIMYWFRDDGELAFQTYPGIYREEAIMLLRDFYMQENQHGIVPKNTLVHRKHLIRNVK